MLVTVIENLKKTTISRVSEARVSVAASSFPGSGITGMDDGWERVVSGGKAGWWSSAHLIFFVCLRYAEQRVSCLSLQDVLGFNMAGLQHLKREIEAKDEVMFFADATDRFEEKKRKRKKKEKMILAVV